jgi:hypothetical protein
MQQNYPLKTNGNSKSGDRKHLLGEAMPARSYEVVVFVSEPMQQQMATAIIITC